ncbi:MAG: hypothetical protein WD894_14075 [Pirellulales bacterium]
MATAQEVFASAVLGLAPQERLRLAALILEDLTAKSNGGVDWSDSWSDEDIADMSAFSAQQFESRER